MNEATKGNRLVQLVVVDGRADGWPFAAILRISSPRWGPILLIASVSECPFSLRPSKQLFARWSKDYSIRTLRVCLCTTYCIWYDFSFTSREAGVYRYRILRNSLIDHVEVPGTVLHARQFIRERPQEEVRSSESNSDPNHGWPCAPNERNTGHSTIYRTWYTSGLIVIFAQSEKSPLQIFTIACKMS
jgi:hypothetical protein